MYIASTSCCGLKELQNISELDTDEVVLEVAHNRYRSAGNCAIYLFTGVIEEGYAQDLAKTIKKLGLGTCVRTKGKVNPNSSNRISGWLWEVNDTKFKAWWKKNEDRY